MIQIRCINPQQGHAAIAAQLWPWVKSMTMAGNMVDIHAGPSEDAKTDRQRRYYHGVILTEIARQANAAGQKFPMAVWKEYFRDKFLGKKRITFIDPMTGKKSRRHVRISTEDLGIRKYAELIERVTAFAVTELGVTFSADMDEWTDPETGEIMGVA